MEKYDIFEKNTNSFEKQFGKREELKILDGKIEIIDIKPERQKTEIPLLFVRGWATEPELYKTLLSQLYEKNRRVIFLNHLVAAPINPRRIAQEYKTREYPLTEIKKALAMLEIINGKNIPKIDVAAYSEGAIHTIIMASIQPQKFRNIILVAPGGLIGKDELLKLMGRSLTEEFFNMIAKIKNEKNKITFNFINKAIKYIAQNPRESIKEGAAIAKSQIDTLLQEIRKNNIKISIIQGVNDNIFPMSKMQKIIKKGQIDGFYATKGNHFSIISSQSKTYTDLIDKALDDLEKINHQ